MPTTHLGVTADEKVVSSFAKSFAELNKALLDTEVLMGRVSKIDGVRTLTDGIVRGVTKTGTIVTAVLKETDDGLAVIDKRYKQVATTIEKLEGIALKRRATPHIDRFESKVLAPERAKLPTGLTSQDKSALDNAIEQGKRFLTKSGLTGAEMQNVWKLVRANAASSLTGIYADARSIVTKIQHEFEKLASAPTKKLSDAAKITATNYARTRLEAHSATLPANISANDRLGLDAAQQNIYRLISSAGLVGAQFDKVWTHVRSGAQTQFQGVEEVARLHLMKIMKMYDDLIQVAGKRDKAAAGAAMAGHTPTIISGVFGPKPSNFKRGEEATFDRVQQGLKAMVASGEIEFGRFNKILDDLVKGHITPNMDAADRKVRSFGQTIATILTTAAERANKATQKTTDDTAKATAAKYAQGIVQSMAASKLGHFIKPEDTIALEQVQQKIAKLTGNLKVMEAGFDAAWAHVQSGAKGTMMGIEEDVRIAIVQMMNELKRLEKLDTKRLNQVKGAGTASIAPYVVETTRGPVGKGAKGTELLALDRIKEKMKQLAQSAGMDAGRFTTIIQDVFSGKLTATLTQSEARMRAYAQSYDAVMTRIEGRTKAHSDKIREQNIRDMKAGTASQDLKKLFDRPTAPVGMPQMNLSRGFKGELGEKVRREMASIMSMLRKGKADWADYEAAVKSYSTKSSADISEAAEKIRQKLANIGKAIEDTAKKSSVAAQVFNKGWQFVKGAIIVDALGRAKDKIVETTQAAADFQKQIALIQTISADSGMTFDEWAEGLEKVANKIGRPIEEVAKSAYDAISNQIVKGRETFAFLESAGKFARTSNTGLADATNLLSTQLNATGQDFSQAEAYAAKFFKVIDLGKISGSELAHSLGRTSSLVKSLGGDMDEALGIMTGMTKAGINFDESTTLVNNMMIAMINPSKELQAAFDKLKTHMGDATIKLYGTLGALVKLREMAGSKAAFADMFPEIRRYKAADFVSTNVDAIVKDVAKIKDAMKGYDISDAFTTENIGQKFIVELNKINTYWLTGFQTTVLKMVTFFNEHFLSLSNTVKVAYAGLGIVSIPLAVGAGLLTINKIGLAFASIMGPAAVTSWTAGMASITNSMYSLAAAGMRLLGPLGLIALGIGYITIKAYEAYNELDNMTEAANKLHKAQADAENAATAKDLSSTKNKIIADLEDSEKVVLRVVRDEQAAVDSLMEKVKEAGKETKNAIANTMEEMLQAGKRSISDLERALSKAMNTVNATRKFVDKEQPQDFDDRKYHRQRTVNDINVSNRAAQSSAFGNTAGEPDDIYAQRFDRSDEIAKRRIEQLKKMSQVAAGEGDWDSAKKHMSDISHLQDEIATRTVKIPIYVTGAQGQRVDSGKRYEALKNPDYGKDIEAEYGRQRALSQAIGAEKKRTAENMQQQLEIQRSMLKTLEDMVKELKDFTALNKDGTVKKEFLETGSAAAALGKMLDSLYAKALAFEAQSKKGFALLDKEDQRDANTVHPRQFKDRTEASRAPAAAAQEQHEREAEAGRQSSALKTKQSQIQTETESAKKRVTETVAELTEAEAKIVVVEKEIKDSITRSAASLTHVWEGAGFFGVFERAFGNVFGRTITDSEIKIQELAFSIKKMLGTGDWEGAREKVLAFEAAVAKAGDLDTKATAGGKAAGNVQDVIKNLLDEIEARRLLQIEADKLRAKLGQEGAGSQSAKAFTDSLKKGLEELGPATTQFSGTIKTQFAAVDARVKTTEGIIDGLIIKLRTAFNKAQELKSEPISTNEAPESAKARAEAKWMGGDVGYFSEGGAISDFMNGRMSHGRDTQPIMADPEEFIVNADSTRKFSSQLRAINSGINPVSSGGSTTNVGDIHVNVNGGSNSGQTINEIASGLNRAIRRGTVKFRG